MTPTQYNALKNSIKEYGGIMEGQRIIVTPTDNDYYRILNGEHRWRALKELGYDEAPVLIVELKDEAEEKLVSLALANTGDVNKGALLEIVDSMLEDYNLNEIEKFIGEPKALFNNFLSKFDDKDYFKTEILADSDFQKDSIMNKILGSTNDEESKDKSGGDDKYSEIKDEFYKIKMKKWILELYRLANKTGKPFNDLLDEACKLYIKNMEE